MSWVVDDRVVIVTGAAQGVGRGVAEAFAKDGADVVLADIQSDLGQSVCDDLSAAGCRARFMQVDLSSESSIRDFMHTVSQTYGRIDVLASCCGIYPVHALEEMSLADWNRVLAVNLTAPFLLTRDAVLLMKRQGKGRIIFTSTVTGPSVVVPGLAHYGASKAGLEGLMRTAALELAPLRITVNAVAPGVMLSPGLQKVCSPEEIDALGRRIPLGRIGYPSDIAAAYLFLATDAAEYITGITIRCDGGYILPEPVAVGATA